MKELKRMNIKNLRAALNDLCLTKMGFKAWEIVFLDFSGYICCY